MLNRKALVLAVLVSALAGSTASAQDYDNDGDYDGPGRGVARDRGHLDVKFMLGVGGEVEFDPEVGPTVDDDLLVSYGLGLAYVHPLHRFFALGAQLSFSAWLSENIEDLADQTPDDDDGNRNVFIDLSLLPQGRYAINNDVELNLSLPIGPSLSIPGDDEAAGGEIDTAIGLHIGLMLGARFALSDNFGLLAELGYIAHSAAHEVDTPAGAFDFDVSLGQFAINLGVWF